MTLVILAAGLAGFGGLVATYAYDEDGSLVDRLIAGLASGLALVAAGGLVGSLAAGIDAGAAVGVIVSALPIGLLARAGVRDRLAADGRTAVSRLAHLGRPGGFAAAEVAFAIAMLALLWLVFDRVMLERDGAILTGYVNNLGDLPFHLQVTSSFAYGENFPPTDPGYAGSTFSYPYLSDLVAAILVRLGASFQGALFLQNLVLGVALVGLLHRLTRVLTRDRLAAALAPLLLLLSGGLGFVTLIDDARRGEHGLLAVLGSLTHDVTITGEGPWRWGNAITTLLVTQRGLLFGIPVALLVLVLLIQLIRVPAGDRDRRLRPAIAAGALAGILPLIHLHTFAVTMGTAAILWLLFRQWRERRWEAWLAALAIALILALPAVISTTLGSQANLLSFVGIALGWDHGSLDPVTFWLLNTGIFIPLAVAGLYLVARSELGVEALPGAPRRELLLFTLAFLPWFLVPNVLRLAPWIWDNNKVLIWWYIGFIPVVALVVAGLLRRRGGWRLAGATGLLLLTLSGSIDVWRVISRQTEYGEFNADAVAIAEQIREVTPPDAVILHAPTWNTPVYLTGRRSVLGYPGHIWSRGLPYAEREQEIGQIYADAPDAQALLAKYGVDYVLVGPLEREQLSVDDNLFAGMQLVAEAGDERLYEVTSR